MLEFICVVSFVTLCLCLSSIKFLKDYERLVIFRFGRLCVVRGPGPQIVWPFIETYKKVDLRIMTLPVSEQMIITRDKMSVSASAVCYYQIADAKKAVLHIDDYRDATAQVVQGVFKDVLKMYELGELTAINKRVIKVLRSQIEPKIANWGIRIAELTLSVAGSVSEIQLNPRAVVESSPVEVSETEVSETELPESPSAAATGLYEQTSTEHHHKIDHGHHRKHKHSHHSFENDFYDFGHHSYEFGHEKKAEPPSG